MRGGAGLAFGAGFDLRFIDFWADFRAAAFGFLAISRRLPVVVRFTNYSLSVIRRGFIPPAVWRKQPAVGVIFRCPPLECGWRVL